MSQPAEPRVKNSEATAARIVEAARAVFGEKGYEAAGTREIAQRAGVNVALINRYFGSKAGLFAAAVPPSMAMDKDLLAAGDFSALIAAKFANMAPKDDYDPIMAFLRSAPNPEAADMLREAVQGQVIDPIADHLEGDDAEARAILIATQLVGFVLWARVLSKGEIEEPLRARLQAHLEQAIEGLASPKEDRDHG